MFHVKNVPVWERVLRLVVGAASLVFVAMNWGTSSLSVAIGVTGAVLALTGLVGFCPMCAMVGRKLDARR